MQNIENLERYINSGTDLVRARDFRGAISYFQDRNIAESLDFDLVLEENPPADLGERVRPERFMLYIRSNISRCGFLAPEGISQRERGVVLLRDISPLDRYGEDPRWAEDMRVEAARNVAFCFTKTWMEGLYSLKVPTFRNPRSRSELRERDAFVAAYCSNRQMPIPDISLYYFLLNRL